MAEIKEEEPLWRTVLCWTAVITFFTAPALIFGLHIFSIEQGWDLGHRWEEFKGIAGFYTTITTLVFGLAGLRSFDRAWQIKHNGNNGNPSKPELPPADELKKPDSVK